MRPMTFVISYAAASAVSIAALQTLGTAGSLTLNGPLAKAYNPMTGVVDNAPLTQVATLLQQGRVTLTSANNLSAVTFTITGTDSGGNVVSETIAGPNASTVTSAKSYSTITSIRTNGAVTAVSVGTANYGETNFLPTDIYVRNQLLAIQVDVLSGAPNYSMTFTDDDPFNPSITPNEQAINASLTGATTTVNYQSTQIMRALKFYLNSATVGASSVRVTITQQSTR